MAKPITTLELRTIEIPRSPVLDLLERELGRPITHETRHYLAGQPVHCGDFLEFFDQGTWVLGRYEWTCQPGEPPTLHFTDRILRVADSFLLRWPK